MYNSYYYFLLMFDFVFDDIDKINTLEEQLNTLEITLSNYFQSMVDVGFSRMFNHFEVEFSAIKRNLLTIKRVNTLEKHLVELIDKNITIIDKYIEIYNEEYIELFTKTVESDVEKFCEESGLTLTSFEILNYLTNTSYSSKFLDTLNNLIEYKHFEPFLDVLTSIHSLLECKDTHTLIPYPTAIFIEELSKKHDNLELVRQLDNYNKEDDIHTRTTLLKHIHLSIINKQLDMLYENTNY